MEATIASVVLEWPNFHFACAAWGAIGAIRLSDLPIIQIAILWLLYLAAFLSLAESAGD